MPTGTPWGFLVVIPNGNGEEFKHENNSTAGLALKLGLEFQALIVTRQFLKFDVVRVAVQLSTIPRGSAASFRLGVDR